MYRGERWATGGHHSALLNVLPRHAVFKLLASATSNNGPRGCPVAVVSDVEFGGETVFPMTKKSIPPNRPGNWSDSGATGLGIQPRAGTAKRVAMYWSIS